ncbi:sialidase family protein [Prosthecobacter sp.]|uniref:sialidase family protein n=1 Tax=Prosthecobacter sp. TaxID=1965333 RepID=UPI003783FDB1
MIPPRLFSICALIFLTCHLHAAMPSVVNFSPGVEAEDGARTWQGIPGIERAPNGRLWSIWYSGALSEGLPGNYCVVASSGDDGMTWSTPLLLIKGPTPQSSTFDPVPWLDPKGRLWLFYVQTTRDSDGKTKAYGTYAIRTDSPDETAPKWSEPFLVFSGGRMFGKPILGASGEWLAPIYVDGKPAEKETGVLSSTNEGASWEFSGGTCVPKDQRNFSEHTLARRKNGDLWMVIRTMAGLGESTSTDGGRTWTDPIPFRDGPNTRAHVRRLASGAFLLVYHDLGESDKFQLGPKGRPMYPRSQIAVWLSDDEGRTWPHKLLLDARECSYPDATQAADGRIYIAYDSWRYGCRPGLFRYDPGAGPGKEIALAVIREEDIRAGKIVSPGSWLHQVVNRATGCGNTVELKKDDERKMREEVNKSLPKGKTSPIQ